MTTPRFSQRIGLASAQNILQTNTMSDELRNSLWNLIFNIFDKDSTSWLSLNRHSAQRFFKIRIDDLPDHHYYARKMLKDQFYRLDWFCVYDFCEYISQNYLNIIYIVKMK